MRASLQSLWVWMSAVIVAPVQAGTVEQAILHADPQMQVKEGAIQGCGYRITGIPQDLAGPRPFVLLDASFNLYRKGGLALLKGGAMQVQIKDGKPGPAVNRPIERFWIKAQGEKPTAPVNGRVLAAETKGYLLYGVSIAAVTNLFGAVLENKTLMVGARIKGEPVDRIYSGSVQISEQDKAQGHECMTELIKQMEMDIGSEAPAPR